MKKIILNKKMSIFLIILAELELIFRSFVYIMDISGVSKLAICLIIFIPLLLSIAADIFFLVWFFVFLYKSKTMFEQSPAINVNKNVYNISPLFFISIITIIPAFFLLIFLDSKTYNIINAKIIFQVFLSITIFCFQILYLSIFINAKKYIKNIIDKNEKFPVEYRYIKDKNGNISHISLFNKRYNLKPFFPMLRAIPPFSLFFDKDKTIEIYKEIIEKNDNSDDYCALIAILYTQKNDCENALIYIDKAIKINEDDGDSFELKGMLLFEMEKYEEALACLLKAEEKTKLEIDSLIAISIIYSILGDSVNAFYYSQKALKKDKNNGRALCAQGIAYYIENKNTQAFSSFKKAKKNGCTYASVDEYLNKFNYRDYIDKSINNDIF